MHKADAIAAFGIFALTAIVFLISPVRQIFDSAYSMVLSQSVLDRGRFDLDDYSIPRLEPTPGRGVVTNGAMYQLEIVNGHLYYFFPPGSSLLSAPFVGLMNALGISAINADGSYNKRGEVIIQGSLAGLLMAGLAALVFVSSRLLLPYGYSALLALAIAFGTQVWSTASRALWTDTWSIFLLGPVVWMLLAQETNASKLRPFVLASLLSWAYFCRPTNSISVAGVSLYVLLFHRAYFLRLAVAGAAWLAVFFAYSWYHFGQFLPNYYRADRLTFDSFWSALVGNLISPSRGLLVYVPVVLFAAYLLIRYRHAVYSRRLMLLGSIIVATHLIVVSGFEPWYGGHCYGPRYTTGIVPWFALLGILGVGAWRTSRLAGPGDAHTKRRLFKTEVIAGSLLLAFSVVVNMFGATSRNADAWNVLPVNVDDRPERVWDWNDPQFLAIFRR